eukprot:m.82533 g.82533  ORF g.82533 m.82533 type:complete len:156 (+) comp12874_c0_seq6:781-1248(+)
MLGPITNVSGAAFQRGKYPERNCELLYPGGPPGKVEDVVHLNGLIKEVPLSCTFNFATPIIQDEFKIRGTEGCLRFSCFGTEPLQLSKQQKDGTVSEELIEIPALEHVQQPLIQIIVHELSGTAGIVSPSKGALFPFKNPLLMHPQGTMPSDVQS